MSQSQREMSSYQDLLEFIVKNNGVVIIQFYSPCTPCKLIEPHLEKFKKTYNLPVIRLDSDKAEQLASKFDVHAIPTYILVRKTGGDIEIAQTVVSAHVEKLNKLFEAGVELKTNRK